MRLDKRVGQGVAFLFSGLAVAGLLMLVLGLAMYPSGSQDTLSVYVGTWTEGQDDGGIHVLELDPSTGALSSQHPVTPAVNPSYLTLSPDGRYLYSVNQTTDAASVSAYEVDEATGALTVLNTVPAGGASPCYISIDASGEWVLVANYVSGTVAVFPVRADGSLGPPTDRVQHTGSSVHPERQTAPHAHYFDVDPSNRFALAVDLGIDQVRIYPLDTERGRIEEQRVRDVTTPPGTGPRHLDFHPNGQYAYLVGELTGTVTAYRYDPDKGQMDALQTISSLPEGFDGTNKSADIHVHPSGAFLYASNRGDADSIVIYAIDPDDGTLSLVGHQDEAVEWPRNFAIDPSGQFLLVANRHANRITVFRIDEETGALTFTGHAADVPEPMCIKFLATS